MPQGGLSMFGAGLQLQQVFPGTVNLGNANLSGTLVAGRGIFPGLFGTNSLRTLWGDTDPNSPTVATVIGDRATVTWLGPGHDVIRGAICIGAWSDITQKVGMGALNGVVAIGAPASNNETGGVCIGYSTVLGGPNGLGALGGVVIGGSSGVINYGGFASGGGVSIGNSTLQTTSINTIRGSRNSVLLGSQILEDREADLGVGVPSGGNILINMGTAPMVVHTIKNSIFIQTGAAGAYGVQTFAGLAESDRIRIGDATHTRVQIGPFDLAAIAAATVLPAPVLVNDANVNINANGKDVRIIYTAISAARTANLPLAVANPGVVITIVDRSGTVTAVNSINVKPSLAGGDFINGVPAPTTNNITTAFGGMELVSDGVNSWTIIQKH